MAASTAPKREFPLAPPSRPIWPWLLGLWIVLLAVGFLQSSHVQPPHNPVPWWVMILFGTALFPVGLWATLAHRQIAIDGDKLKIAAALIVSHTVPIRELMLDKARILDLDEHTEFKPLLRLYGASLPGFTAGYCLLRNRSRAFCLLTARRNVLLLPQRNGKYVLISPEKPQALLDELRRPT